jgi:hypothetical protein
MNQAFSPSAQLKPHQRQQIALRVLTKQETISGIAEKERVSRKFLYKQGHITQNTLNSAFEKPKSDKEVLFYLPVTQKWLSKYKNSSVDYWREWNRLHHLLPNKFHLILDAVSEAMATTPRTSSLVENLNSRLRNYFFLRKQLGSGYLDLLRFFLNHRTFMRSRHPERVGKSPAELMMGQEHPHWLELLEFERFQRA